MATSKLEVYNSALIKMGEETVSSTSDTHKRARLVNEQYDKCRREVLRAHPWVFAMKRAQLSAEETGPAFGYQNRYELPSDALRVWKAWGAANTPYDRELLKYEVEGKFLLTDEDTVYILYIADISDVTLFDAQFEEVLALRLAGDTAYAITQSRSLTNDLVRAYQTWEAQARSANGQVGTPDAVIEGDWLAHRIDGGW